MSGRCRRLSIGDTVVDSEDDDPDGALVVNLPPVACDDWGVDRGDDEDRTVADDNPSYPADAPVVVVAFRSDLSESHPEYEGEVPLDLPAECKTYAFPAPRLDLVDDEDGDGVPKDLAALRERLAETATVEVVEEGGEHVLAVEKLGAEYRITQDGTVTDGPLAADLRDVAEAVLGGEEVTA